MILNQYVELVKEIVLDKLAPYRVRVYLFGSRANGMADNASDIDVGIEPFETLPVGLLSDIREQLEESNVPYTVDLVDLTIVSDKLVDLVRQEGVIWKDCR